MVLTDFLMPSFRGLYSSATRGAGCGVSIWISTVDCIDSWDSLRIDGALDKPPPPKVEPETEDSGRLSKDSDRDSASDGLKSIIAMLYIHKLYKLYRKLSIFYQKPCMSIAFKIANMFISILTFISDVTRYLL